MAARVAAARAVAEALTLARPLEERLAADLSLRAGGFDPRDRALARSIATVALRRLGTIRKALARRMEKSGRSSSPRRRSSFSIRPIMRPSTSRSRRRAPIRPARHSRRLPTQCCARSLATAT
jgi:hypothetical protein